MTRSLTAEDINVVVAKFYAAVRKDSTLSAVFNNHIDDWPEHEKKIAAFWRNAILRERSYEGNPMRAHQEAGDVTVGHFPIWLGLFDEVLMAELPEPLAQAWSRLAHRIGQGLSYGLAANTGVPQF